MQQRLSTKEDYLKRVNIVVEYINTHLGENIDISVLAELSGFSPYHFHRIMRAYLREPLGAFILRMRVETAARLLRYSDMAVQDIAYRVGYDVPSSLSKVFKQFYGISPNEYRINKQHVIMKPVEMNSDLKVDAEVRELEAKQVIYIRQTGYYKDLDYCGAWKRLFAYIFEQNLYPEYKGSCPPGIEFLCIYHDDPKVTEADKLRTDVCLSISRPVQPRGEIGVKVIPAGKYAIFRYRGPYDKLYMVYDTIYGKWLLESGYRVKDSFGFENYLNSPEDTRPEDLLTEICVPIE